MKHVTSFALITFLTLCLIVPAQADVTDTPAERQLSLPGANWKLILPREDWTITKEQIRPDSAVVYYALASEKKQIIISMYIDKAATCKTGVACLESALSNVSYKSAKDLKRGDVGPFSIASFYLDEPQGYPVKQANVLAEALFEDCWIDIHISKTAKDRPDQSSLIDVLKSISLKKF